MYLRIFAFTLLVATRFATGEECKQQSINSFYEKVKNFRPLESELENRLKASSHLITKASQRPNPDVDFEYLRGDQFGLSVNTYSISLGHTIEFGDKRQKRIESAKIQNEIDGVDLELRRLTFRVESLLSFQKLAQTELKIKSLKEAIATFNKILKRLNSRSRLNPEERISVTTLRLATNDYQARLNDLLNEKEVLLGTLEFITTCKNFSPSYQVLSYKKLNLKEKAKSRGLLRVEELKPKLFEAEFNKEKSLAYSDIKIGPVVEYQNQGEDEFLSAGVALTFSLPLFQTNDGGKKLALKSWQAQKTQSKNDSSKLKIQKERLSRNYQRSLKVLAEMPTLNSLEKGHQEIEKLFSRGIVSIPLVIESHRQLIDFLDSRFETENDLLNSLKDIAIINGNQELIEEILI